MTQNLACRHYLLFAYLLAHAQDLLDLEVPSSPTMPVLAVDDTNTIVMKELPDVLPMDDDEICSSPHERQQVAKVSV